MELSAHPESAPAWRQIRAELRRAVGESTYEIWLAPLEVQSWDNAVLLLSAPPAIQAWVSKRYARIVEACAQDVTGSSVHVAFTATDPSGSQRSTPRAPADPAIGDGLNPRYRFDQFIIGDGNHLALTASLAVAELPGQAYNPLFLHAPPGLGKTHLLHAIGNYVLAFGGGATVRYTTVEAFTNHFIAALSSRSLDRFKHAYRDADVLLIDDVQFLASKAKTEEEFFHTFNALYENGRQLILTCDRLPQQLIGVEDRLRERFESGLVADIAPPDFATRVAILRKRASLDQIVLTSPDVLELIAERVTNNVRALEGALIRIVAYHSLTGHPIDLELAGTVLDRMYPETRSTRTTVDGIQSTVASRYGLSVEELTSPTRVARVAWPRQLAIHLAREFTGCSLHAIGQAFGGRNHATVLHASKRVSERALLDPEAKGELDELTAMIRGRGVDRNC